MKRRNRKVAKYRRPIHINVGTIIFVLIFIYVLINVWIYFSKEQLSIYEVVEKNIADNNSVTGIILRDETVVMAQNTGFLNYYKREGERVAKNSLVYTIDGTGNVLKDFNTTYDEEALNKTDIRNIQSDISDFRKNYSNSNYKEVYNFKYNIENTIFELSNQSVVDNLETYLKETDNKNAFQTVKAEKSGIITYFIDGMEDLKAEEVTAEMIEEKKDDGRTLLRSEDKIEVDTPVYKVVTSENWSIVVNLSEEQYDKLKEETSVKITFLKDKLTTNVAFAAYKQGDHYLAKMDLKKYMVRYINERFINIEISTNSANGLKIPVSSIIKKEFYKIPIDYFTIGGDSGKKGIVVETMVEGNSSYNFVATEVYYEDEEFGYIDKSKIEKGDTIRSADNNETYVVTETGELEGVYNVNKGYAEFRRVEKIYENSEYYIVRKDTDKGLNVYDHIVLDGSTAVEQGIIY